MPTDSTRYSVNDRIPNKTIQGVKKAHVRGQSELASSGKELHDRAINPLMHGVFVQERSSTS